MFRDGNLNQTLENTDLNSLEFGEIVEDNFSKKQYKKKIAFLATLVVVSAMLVFTTMSLEQSRSSSSRANEIDFSDIPFPTPTDEQSYPCVSATPLSVTPLPTKFREPIRDPYITAKIIPPTATPRPPRPTRTPQPSPIGGWPTATPYPTWDPKLFPTETPSITPTPTSFPIDTLSPTITPLPPCPK